MPEIINNKMYQVISFPSILQMNVIRHSDSDMSIVQTFIQQYLEYQQQDRDRLLSTEARELVKLQDSQLMVKFLEKVRPATLLKLLEYNDFRQEYQKTADINKIKISDCELDEKNTYHKVTLCLTRK